MRTTVAIDDDVLEQARQLARERGVSLGRVLSEMARRGLRQGFVRTEEGLPVLDVAPEAPIIRTEDVLRARDEP